MTDVILLALFSLALGVAVVVIARRDIVVAGFLSFFFVYTIFAMVGYRFFPAASASLRLYFGPDVYPKYFAFVSASFAAFIVAFACLWSRLAKPDRFGVSYHPTGSSFPLALWGLLALLVLMVPILVEDYEAIGYGRRPQIPSFFLLNTYKELPPLLFTIYAVVRQHERERRRLRLLIAAATCGLVLFLVIEVKAGNRSDLVALGLAVLFFEVFGLLCEPNGGLSLARLRRHLRTLGLLGLVSAVVLLVAWQIQSTRSPDLVPVPPLTRVLMNDYYTPAHMLFAAIHLDFVQPLLALKSLTVNTFYLGRVLDVPYLQENIANTVIPLSSSRDSSFAFFIFCEGWVVMGPWGFIYNALVPLLGIALWRWFSSSTDARFNQFVVGLTAMNFAVVTRSGSYLFPRSLLPILLPSLVLFMALTGARMLRIVRSQTLLKSSPAAPPGLADA